MYFPAVDYSASDNEMTNVNRANNESVSMRIAYDILRTENVVNKVSQIVL